MYFRHTFDLSHCYRRRTLIPSFYLRIHIPSVPTVLSLKYDLWMRVKDKDLVLLHDG